MSKPRQVILDMLFAHEVLRRLGFPSDNIFAGVGNIIDVGPAYFVEVKTPRGEWRWIIGNLEEDAAKDGIQVEWAAAVEEWNALDFSSNADPWEFDKSEIRGMAASVIRSLVAKGLYPL